VSLGHVKKSYSSVWPIGKQINRPLILNHISLSIHCVTIAIGLLPLRMNA